MVHEDVKYTHDPLILNRAVSSPQKVKIGSWKEEGRKVSLFVYEAHIIHHLNR